MPPGTQFILLSLSRDLFIYVAANVGEYCCQGGQ